MKRRYSPLLYAMVMLALAGLACQAITGATPAANTDTPEPQDQSPVLEPTERPTQVPVQPTVSVSQGTGILCAGTNSGLNCLEDDGWQLYTDENSDLPNNYLYAGALCPDGQMAVAHIDGVSLFDGSAFKQIPEMESSSSPDGIACDASGGIWVAHFQGISHYADNKWETIGSENFATGESANELVYDVKVAPDGKVWVVTSRSVAMFENGTWTIFQEGQGFEGSRFFNALALDANGRPWAAHSSGVDVFENGAWSSFESADYNTPEVITIDAHGQAWLGTISGGAYLFDGSTWTNYDRASETVRSNYVTSITTDSSGRVWFGTSYGLTAFNGAQWQTYLMSNSGLSDNDIRFLIVTNDGPILPAPEEKPNGSLTGTLKTADGNPLSAVNVEICVETIGSTFYGDTPCSDQPFFLTTQTDAEGMFLFENVPAGYYVIVAETGTSWAQLTDEFGISSERTLIEAGEQYDIGELRVEE